MERLHIMSYSGGNYVQLSDPKKLKMEGVRKLLKDSIVRDLARIEATQHVIVSMLQSITAQLAQQTGTSELNPLKKPTLRMLWGKQQRQRLLCSLQCHPNNMPLCFASFLDGVTLTLLNNCA